LERIERSRKVIERIIREGQTVYGVNTGFGKLADVHIPRPNFKPCSLIWFAVIAVDLDSHFP